MSRSVILILVSVALESSIAIALGSSIAVALDELILGVFAALVELL